MKQYIDPGGRVLVSTYALSSSWAVQGGIPDNGYSPFIPETSKIVSGTIDIDEVLNINHTVFGFFSSIII